MFLKAEAIAMSIFEYDKEEEEKKLRKAEYEYGYENAKKEMAVTFCKRGMSVHEISEGLKVPENKIKKWIKESE